MFPVRSAAAHGSCSSPVHSMLHYVGFIIGPGFHIQAVTARVQRVMPPWFKWNLYLARPRNQPRCDELTMEVSMVGTS